jgi:hypothetical protein
MRYISFVIPYNDLPPTPELMDAMGKLAEREMKAGRLIDMGGLMPVNTATRVAIKKSKLLVSDGPFAESKEVIGGYAVFEFATKEEAVASAVEFMDLHKQFCPGWEGVCEVRQLAPMDAPDVCGGTSISSAA